MTGTEQQNTTDGSVERSWWPVVTALLIFVSVVVFFYRSYQIGGYFTEDAYISFRFATNFAEGHGLVWNVGEEPVEGFTSPLHVLILAIGIVLGIPASWTTQFIGFASVLGIVVLSSWLLRKETGGVSPLAALFFSVFLIDTRTAIHATAGLDTPLFMFLLVLNLALSLNFLKSPGVRSAILLAAINIICLLGRPDAAPFIAGQGLVLVGYSGYQLLMNKNRQLIGYAGLAYLTMLIAGLAYLTWKYFYFGYLLPNPFYIKSNEFLTFRGLGEVLAYAKSLLPVFGLFLAPLVMMLDTEAIKEWWSKAGTKPKLALLVIPTGLFLVYYTTVVHEVSYADRFEYPTYALLCLTGAVLISIGTNIRRSVSYLSLAVALIGSGLFVATVYRSTAVNFPWFKIVEEGYYGPIAKSLQETGLGPKGKIVFTSAGVVPYRSRFTHIDPVGLVDNALSGRQPMEAEERERYIWEKRADVYIGPEPPASAEATDCASDPLMKSPFMEEVLDIYRTSPPYLNSYGKLTKERRCNVIHLRMKELRDNWEFLGEIPFPAPITDLYTTFAYVRKDSPHRRQLIKALDPLITRKPNEIDIGAMGDRKDP